MKQDAPLGHSWFMPDCPTEKRGYYSRRDARAAARATTRHSSTGRLSAYQCQDCRFWHIGHIPPAVRSGDLDRRELEHGHYRKGKRP